MDLFQGDQIVIALLSSVTKATSSRLTASAVLAEAQE